MHNMTCSSQYFEKSILSKYCTVLTPSLQHAFSNVHVDVGPPSRGNRTMKIAQAKNERKNCPAQLFNLGDDY